MARSKKEVDINVLIEEERQNLSSLEKKKAEIESKIKTSKDNIERYSLLINNKAYEQFTTLLSNSGLEFSDIMSALANKDLGALQRRVEYANSMQFEQKLHEQETINDEMPENTAEVG